MAVNLLEAFNEAFEFLDAVDFSQLHDFDMVKLRHKDQRIPSVHC
jgi:hypothetical protein